ncbi:MAG: glycoside hydrolase family 99-like domain-containing protein [Candidatus Azobacteroides sp.]|nr:glycoside hydrolase family 99-like domain-containing protein [Candidatus Azobacteroides sp.]
MKKIFAILSILVLLAPVFIACEDKPNVYEFPTDEYVYDIPDVPVTEDYVVGVAYDVKLRDTLYTDIWWDAGKRAHQLYTGHPVLGEYDLRQDADVLRQHLDWGKEAGIDFFVLSWGGHGLNDTILTNWEQLYAQDNARPKVVIRFDPSYRFMAKDTLQLNRVQMDSLRFELDSLYTFVMQRDFAYKKSDGKPVMILCDFTNAVQIPRLNDFVTFLKGSETIGNNLWIMAELGGGWTSPEHWGYNAANGYNGPSDGTVRADSIKPFDAFFITDISHNNYDRFYSQYSYLDYNYRYWQDRMKPLGKEYIPTVQPGFDDRVNTPGSDRYLIPRWKNGKAYVISSSETGIQYNLSSFTENPYQKWANVAKRNAGDSRIIMIYNWNDFASGINLEPVTEFGTDYLQYTREFFKK